MASIVRTRILLILLAISGASMMLLSLYEYRLDRLNELDVSTNIPLPHGFESYAASAKKIKPLHEKKKPVQPGDWLDRHFEGGQTFAQYILGQQKQPIQLKYNKIYILPIGDFDETQTRIIEQTSEFISIYFGSPVTRLEHQEFVEIPETDRRIRNGVSQVRCRWILNEIMKPLCPDDAVALIGMVTIDLWSDELNWVFGAASLKDRIGVWSLHRNGDPRPDEAAFRLCLVRTLKIAVHETGHMLGIPHCTAYECCMNGSRSREENDRQPLEFCPECQPKLWWTCGVDAATRSRRLAEFATRQGCHRESEFWQKQADLIDGQ